MSDTDDTTGKIIGYAILAALGYGVYYAYKHPEEVRAWLEPGNAPVTSVRTHEMLPSEAGGLRYAVLTSRSTNRFASLGKAKALAKRLAKERNEVVDVYDYRNPHEPVFRAYQPPPVVSVKFKQAIRKMFPGTNPTFRTDDDGWNMTIDAASGKRFADDWNDSDQIDALANRFGYRVKELDPDRIFLENS